jgi:hypothetical protein
MAPTTRNRPSKQSNLAASRQGNSSGDSSTGEPSKRPGKKGDDSSFEGSKQDHSNSDESLQADASDDELEVPHELDLSPDGTAKKKTSATANKTSATAKKRTAAAKKQSGAVRKLAAAAKGRSKKIAIRDLVPSPYRPAREPNSPMDSPPKFEPPAKRWNATEKLELVQSQFASLLKYATKLHNRHVNDIDSSKENLSIAEHAIEQRDRYSSRLVSEVQTLTIDSNTNAQEVKALKSTIESQKTTNKILSGEVDRLKAEIKTKEKSRQKLEDLKFSKNKAAISEESALNKLENAAKLKKSLAEKKKAEQHKRIAELQQRASEFGGMDRNMSNLLKVSIAYHYSLLCNVLILFV